MCQSELTEFFFSQNSPSLPQNSVRLSEFSSPKQYSRNSIPPVSQNHLQSPQLPGNCVNVPKKGPGCWAKLPMQRAHFLTQKGWTFAQIRVVDVRAFGSRGHSCRHPRSKTWGRPSKPWKIKHLGADMHDWKRADVRDPNGCTNALAEELRADFSFPVVSFSLLINIKKPALKQKLTSKTLRRKAPPRGLCNYNVCPRDRLEVGCTPRGSRNCTPLRRVLRRHFVRVSPGTEVLRRVLRRESIIGGAQKVLFRSRKTPFRRVPPPLCALWID